jgi:hypothetical protein
MTPRQIHFATLGLLEASIIFCGCASHPPELTRATPTTMEQEGGVELRIYHSIPGKDKTTIGLPLRWEKGRFYNYLGIPLRPDGIVASVVDPAVSPPGTFLIDLLVDANTTMDDVAKAIEQLAAITKPTQNGKLLVVYLICDRI